MEKSLIGKRFSKAIGCYRHEAAAQRKIARSLIAMMTDKTLPRHFDSVLEIGCGSGLLTREFLSSYTPDVLYLNDLCSEISSRDIAEYMAPSPETELNYIIGDAENMALPQNLDLIISSSVLQWLENPLDFINGNCIKSLNRGGIMAFSIFGPENLYEISSLTDIALEYLPLECLCKELCRNFNLIAVKEEKIVMAFESPRDVLLHLKATGVNGVGEYRWSKGSLLNFLSAYSEKYRLDDGKVHLTYHPYYMILQKRF